MIFEDLLHFQYNFMRKFNPNFFLRPAAEFVKEHYKEELVCAEIGVAHGFNALAMLQNLPIKHLYLVDPWGKFGDDGYKTQRYAEKLLSKYREVTTFINDFSFDACSQLPDNLDFIYIDADKNSYKSAYRDIELMYPKIVSGGVMGGHDFDGHYLNQCKAVIDFTDEYGLYLNTWKKDWWFVK